MKCYLVVYSRKMYNKLESSADFKITSISDTADLVVTEKEKDFVSAVYKSKLNVKDSLLIKEIEKSDFIQYSNEVLRLFTTNKIDKPVINISDNTNTSFASVSSTDNATKLANWCLNNLDLTAPHYAEPYGSLGPCILDCVYSLRAKYFAITVPVVKRYGDKFMNGDVHAKGYTLSDLISHIDYAGGPKEFAENILLNKQVLSDRMKSEVCLELAKKLVNAGIETKEDFIKTEQARLDRIMRSVKGIGDAAVNYLFMLAGDPNRCKPDVHIHHCIRDAIGYDVTNEECQVLFTGAVDLLKKDYPKLTVSALDGLVWSKYRV